MCCAAAWALAWTVMVRVGVGRRIVHCVRPAHAPASEDDPGHRARDGTEAVDAAVCSVAVAGDDDGVVGVLLVVIDIVVAVGVGGDVDRDDSRDKECDPGDGGEVEGDPDDSGGDSDEIPHRTDDSVAHRTDHTHHEAVGPHAVHTHTVHGAVHPCCVGHPHDRARGVPRDGADWDWDWDWYRLWGSNRCC